MALSKELQCEICDDVAKFENGYAFYNNQYYKIADLISKSFNGPSEIDAVIDKLSPLYFNEAFTRTGYRI